MNNSAILTEGLSLAEGRWKDHTNAIVEGYRKSHNGSTPDANILSTTAIMLENTHREMQRLDEATKVVNLGNFVDYGLGIVTAVMPALCAHEIVSVQPLKARTGEIFYFNFKYGTNKGNIKAGDTMFSAINGPNADTNYSAEKVSGEEFFAANAGGVTKVEGSLSYLPVTKGTVEISDGVSFYYDDGKGNLTTSDGTSKFTEGTINYDTGKVTMDFADATTNSFIANYASDSYNFVGDTNAVPEVDIELTSTTITTTTRKLRARWLFDASFELQQTHGIEAEEELSIALAAEVKHEIDGEIMNDLLRVASAGSTEFQWDKTAPYGVSYVDYKDTFVDKLIEMSNAIFADTKRAEGNFIVAGISVCSILESLGGRFVPEKNGVKAGPHIIGTLDGRWKVIKNPFYPNDQFIVGYKGQSYLEGGYVYAPYLPLFTTPTVMLDDFVNRKGVITRYGKKVINPKFYAKGKIVAGPVTGA